MSATIDDYNNKINNKEYGLPLNIIFIRHGESEGNLAAKELKLTGSSESIKLLKKAKKTAYDYRLTKRGVEQARKAGEVIRKYVFTSFDRYYTSDLVRTKETAAHLNFPDAKWITETTLREQQCSERSTKEKTKFVQSRIAPIDEFLDNLFMCCHGMNVIVVCHATTIRSFIIRLEHLHYDNSFKLHNYPILSVDNCQVFWYTRSLFPQKLLSLKNSDFFPSSLLFHQKHPIFDHSSDNDIIDYQIKKEKQNDDDEELNHGETQQYSLEFCYRLTFIPDKIHSLDKIKSESEMLDIFSSKWTKISKKELTNHQLLLDVEKSPLILPFLPSSSLSSSSSSSPNFL